MEIYKNIIKRLEEWNTCGERVLANGTKIICHVLFVRLFIWQNGTQTGVDVRNGKIANGGVNQTPKAYDPQPGLKNNPTK